MDALLKAAKDYCARGWLVVPVDKFYQPLPEAVRCKFKREVPSEEALADWFQKHRADIDSVAVYLGPASGGMACFTTCSAELYRSWCDAHPDLAGSLPTIHSDDGWFVLFKGAVGDGRNDRKFTAVQGDGIIVRIPPSPDRRWLVEPNGELPEVDPAVFDMCFESPKPAASAPQPAPQATTPPRAAGGVTQEIQISNDPQELQRDAPGPQADGRDGVRSNQPETREQEPPVQSEVNPWKLPWKEFVRWAMDDNEAKMDEARAEGKWLSALFHFVRYVKSYLASQDGTITAAKAWRRVDKTLHDLGKEDPNMAEFFDSLPVEWSRKDQPWFFYFDGFDHAGVTHDDAKIEFLSTWEKGFRYEAGYDPLPLAFKLAREKPLTTTRSKEDPELYQEYNWFVSIAGHLQVAMGDRNILLPVEKLGQMMWPKVPLAAAKMRVSRFRKMAEEVDKYITKVRRGHSQSGKADEFRFDVSRFQLLEELAHKNCAQEFEAA